MMVKEIILIFPCSNQGNVIKQVTCTMTSYYHIDNLICLNILYISGSSKEGNPSPPDSSGKLFAVFISLGSRFTTLSCLIDFHVKQYFRSYNVVISGFGEGLHLTREIVPNNRNYSCYQLPAILKGKFPTFSMNVLDNLSRMFNVCWLR